MVAVGPRDFCKPGTFAMVGNLLTTGKYGFKGDGTSPGRPGMDKFLGDGYVFTGNALVGWTKDKFDQQKYPAGNTWISDLADEGFKTPVTANNLKSGQDKNMLKQNKYGARLMKGPSPVGKCSSAGEAGVRVCASSLDIGSNRITTTTKTANQPSTTAAPVDTAAPPATTALGTAILCIWISL